ncbi:MAG TPA: hypothetical protein VE621_23065 [Bryobacteraceae bacterium]|jgi:hypothetical protein|nr:hypothetical protein [Bryobacteraceae bacterium]
MSNFKSLIAFLLLAPAASTFGAECRLPPGFIDTPHPALAPVENLVSHTEEITIERSLDLVLAFISQIPLEETVDSHGPLPSVSGTYMLTQGEFGEPGSRRLTCLTDGSTLVEQVLLRDRQSNTFQFRYVVWNYTSPTAKPISYGVGQFVRTGLEGRTLVRWTYSFQLNRKTFPGFLGPVGDYLFRVSFLERQYADMMRRTLALEKHRVEGGTPVAQNGSWQDEM